jgi:small subunit ribosomal protein S6
MRQYEVTFIIDPVLPNEEITGAAKNYQEHLKQEGCEIVHVDAIGLKPLAYIIRKRSSGIYYTIEFKTESQDTIEKLELALRRDERIMRFLTVKLDKYGVKYNEDKRNGLIGKSKKEDRKRSDDDLEEDSRRGGGYQGRAKTSPPPPPPPPAVEKEVPKPPPPAPVVAVEEEE